MHKMETRRFDILRIMKRKSESSPAEKEMSGMDLLIMTAKRLKAENKKRLTTERVRANRSYRISEQEAAAYVKAWITENRQRFPYMTADLEQIYS